MRRVLGLIIVLLLLAGHGNAVSLRAAQAQSTDFTTQMQQDPDGLWHIECLSGCAFWQSLGTPDELNRRFVVIWDGVDWVYFLMDRRFGTVHTPLPRPS